MFTYFLSFAVIGVFWTRHHRLFGRLRYSDSRFAAINLTFLSFIALLPAPTELLGRYGGETAPTVIYAATIIILALLLRALYRYADDHGLSDVDSQSRAGMTRSAAVIAVFALSIPVAFIEPRAAVYVWVFAAFVPRVMNARFLDD